MALAALKKISDLKYTHYYEYVVGVLASILVFRKPATVVIILFFLVHLLFISKLKWDKRKWVPLIIIALPFLLDVFFIWNNQDIGDGFKHMEKRVSTFLFPLFIIFQFIALDLKKIFKIYSICFTSLLALLFLRFVIVEPDLFKDDEEE